MYSANEIEQIGVAGAGVMGLGIAQVAAQAGYSTVVYDPHEAAIAKAQAELQRQLERLVEKGKLPDAERWAILGRMGYTTELAMLNGDLIIEAAPERLELKHTLLNAVQAANEDGAILATNTSTIPISQIAAGLARPEALVGMHFFNPAPLMPLVEVIAGAATHPTALATVLAVAQQMGKTPVQVADTPGFIVNRVARPYYLESLRIAEEGGIDFATIDDLLRGAGFRMGPFELMDLIGIDTNHAVSQTLYAQFFHEPRFRPSRLQQQWVDAGRLGRKTGQGVYPYPNP
ncbi:MAG: 3-hydroxyacyl-CoA dehydrogenase NAD-binding domain-containing protein [Bacteroidia bacterium]|nr:3-hydroxyacyl-CoA dehydrogenase NAD-binding domain-containing protein [Bacteroidia bacterium]